MALNQIPVLDANWPLFDWADHQESRNALVQGGPTKYFAKIAWNDLVDNLAAALDAGGLEWDETYTTADGARMTDTDGQLTAAKFNSVRLNIDHPVPLGWVWSYDPDFRGYLGRVEVRGQEDVGIRADIVYPEYIIELARKLNVLLEIMRGTGLLAEIDAPVRSGIVPEIELRAGRGAPVVVDACEGTRTQVDAVALRSASMESAAPSATVDHAGVAALRGAAIAAGGRNNTITHAKVEATQTQELSAASYNNTTASTLVENAHITDTGAESLMRTIVQATAAALRMAAMAAGVATNTVVVAQGNAPHGVAMSAGDHSNTLICVEGDALRQAVLAAEGYSNTILGADAVSRLAAMLTPQKQMILSTAEVSASAVPKANVVPCETAIIEQSTTGAEMAVGQVLTAESQTAAGSVSAAEVTQTESFPLELAGRSDTRTVARVAIATPLHLESRTNTCSTAFVEMVAECMQHLPVVAELISGIFHDIKLVLDGSSPAEVWHESFARISAEVEQQQTKALGGVTARLSLVAAGHKSAAAQAGITAGIRTEAAAEIRMPETVTHSLRLSVPLVPLANTSCIDSAPHMAEMELSLTHSGVATEVPSRTGGLVEVSRLEPETTGQIVPTARVEICNGLTCNVTGTARSNDSSAVGAALRIRQQAEIKVHFAGTMETGFSASVGLIPKSAALGRPSHRFNTQASVGLSGFADTRELHSAVFPAQAIVRAFYSGAMRNALSVPLPAACQTIMTEESTIRQSVSCPGDCATRIHHETDAELRALPSAPVTSAVILQMDTPARLIQSLSAPVSAGTDVRMRAQSDAAQSLSAPIFAGADTQLEPAAQPVLSPAHPVQMDAKAHADSNVTVRPLAAGVVYAPTRIQAGTACNLRADDAKAVSQDIICRMQPTASLAVWSRPVQTGSNLLIRQAYKTIQEGTNLLII